MATYYILKQGHKKGPYSLQELKKENIQPTTHIWTLGMDDWREAQEIAELSDLLQEIPPPVPPMPYSFLVPSILGDLCKTQQERNLVYCRKISSFKA